MDRGRVAIVGGGLAGLAAGVELKERGWTVELFERSRLLGGRATSFEIEGHEVDNGQHVFLGACTEFVRFAERVGMGDCLFLQDRFEALVFRDGIASRLSALPLPAPWHVALSFAGYKHLSWPARLGVVRVLLGIANARTSDASFADWLRGRGQGEEARVAFWEPFIVPALNAPLERIPARDAAFVLQTAFMRDAAGARFGWSTVPLAHVARAAAGQLDAVHAAAPVFALERERDAIALHLEGGRCARFDAVVLAVAPPQLAHLAGADTGLGLPALDGWEPQPIVDVHLWHDAGRLPFDFAALLDSPVQWIFQKADGYLCCSLSAADEMLRSPTEAVSARAWDEVRRSIPALCTATLVRSAVTRNPNATFLPRAGTVRPQTTTADPRVALAGSWIDTGWPDTMESAVRSGFAAARALDGARLPDAVPSV
ncbi:MAG: FAD-dependent oxidoreductase [Candidatus Eremiobacteraeota bacterium]|nr:FAD-dependent oxidoreductase [Candidatus Eremiobacteraeota bacterium]